VKGNEMGMRMYLQAQLPPSGGHGIYSIFLEAFLLKIDQDKARIWPRPADKAHKAHCLADMANSLA